MPAQKAWFLLGNKINGLSPSILPVGPSTGISTRLSGRAQFRPVQPENGRFVDLLPLLPGAGHEHGGKLLHAGHSFASLPPLLCADTVRDELRKEQ